MGEFEPVAEGVYQVGGSDLSDPSDAAVYAVVCEQGIVMIDCGAGKAPGAIVENMHEAGLDPDTVTTLILTHCHVDHIGSVEYFRRNFGCSVAAHDLDAGAIESGDPSLTAARWYNTTLPKTVVDRRLKGEHEVIACAPDEIHCLHTPGHTPGSMAVYLDRQGTRILFGQDIHGPFSREFGSDIGQWRDSMEKLIDLGADILCEGHFGIYRPRQRVQRYIRSYLDQYAGK
ncbi:MAG TPA: MBL fold metallo-hydrolase [Deltaproteobacteria bacterium]|nr:MBL fold metallo-hydrolase [Deltaproteobacteria bacterium]OQC29361.1 MAG: Metallo-beta-lactamase L1 precursor [Deltaproteobacteria bacterium ADurb.Bin072]HRW79188.1 MBL fold metallo-hydrolase [Desulfomonilia bacterium]NMD41035.1 MBL fold metallo-hydrolase [Deltaproteobacteria bacterium]HNQ85063.1 MBL fold metallo-hydrolase [Deltaproteobacteria bacterium]